MELFKVYPLADLTIERANGSYLWDENGVQYLDMYGGHAVISIGHTHPHYVARIKNQLDKIGFWSNSVKIPLQEEFAAKLGKVSGKEDYQLFLVNSGAEANENALKLASFHTRRKKVVAFDHAFHGRTSLAVATTDDAKIQAPINSVEDVTILPLNDIKALETYFKKHGNETAAVILEAIQGVGGIRIADHAFIKAIRSFCDEFGAVYIADEVQCGYGRSGMFYATDYAGVNADIYSMAKGMGNGFPIGAISISPKFKAVSGMLGTTFGGNPLACAAALAVLEVIEEEGLVEKAKSRGTYLMNRLKSIDDIENVRGRGLMIGFDVPSEIKDLRKKLLEDFNVFTGAAKPNVVRLLPSLAISRKQVDEFIDALQECIAEMKEVNAENEA
jgi:acetylornithine/N-succinyldiaminopimelate aminotransferase